VPSIVHGCGQKLHFPSEMAGRTGRCPKCNDPIVVPFESEIRDVKRGGLAPAPKPAPSPPRQKMHLDPPQHWEQYQAFLDGKGPNPRPLVVPANLLLKDEADAKWEAALKKGAPSKFQCPACKERLEVAAMVCTKCGLDLRSGRTLDGKTKLNEAGLDYLKKIPWLQNAPESYDPNADTEDDDDDDDTGGKKKPLVPRRPRRPS
jgi:hypothetical protein